MSRQRTAVPDLPAVNLLSESAFARLAARRLRHRFAGGVVVMMMLVAGVFSFQQMRVDEAQKMVVVEQAETARLTGQTQVLAPVRAFVNGVEVQKRSVEVAMAGEVYLSDVLVGIQDATPPGAQLATVAVTITPTTGADGAAIPDAPSACPGPDPFQTRTVVGCITLSGTARSRAEVGDMVIALGASSLFVEPFISTTTTGDLDQVTFSGSVGLSEKVYSGRYADSSKEPRGTSAPAPDAASNAAANPTPSGGS